ncbi:MAG: hypothetical protein A3F84_19475 [Candidatus Handelsmanbacteria bacterium RIFCSPLOWO2_12_FULL_64_10]|uniref:Uncharacterized protein n=1 Tax=Handelsmanbacteria sp. (strain RIFCSPLOWO2_12_FULL_64_10) TaxID=1817868 RepID=A0A1F6D532_HANXR|nr:MAG: hypothetical protein A3F84_19475 [Candidatus Handelsmanbacteria bacterium RIFCSPLOWO2_12_FULL_64_10]
MNNSLYRFDAEGESPIRRMLADAMERAVGARSERYLFEIAAPILVATGRAPDLARAEALLIEQVGEALLDAFDLLGVDHDRSYERFHKILKQLHEFLKV